MKLATKVGIFTVRSGAPALLLALAVTQVCGQEPPPIGGDGFPPPPDGEGQFGGPPGRRQGQPGRQMKLTPAIVPASALTAYLNLTPDQSTRLLDIIERLRAARPRPGAGRQAAVGADAATIVPTQDEMRAARPRFEAAIAKTNQEIASLLDDRQTKRLPTIMKAFKALQIDSISLNAAARLRLTEKQIDALASLGESPSKAAIVESFTTEQREIVDLNRTAVRRGPPGGGQGFGPPGGGPGFGPPPDGGPGGPPDGGPGGPPGGPPD